MFKLVMKRILLAIPMLIVMYIIFGFSGADGAQSGSFSLMISEWVSDVLDAIDIDVSASELHLPIRKLAHMSEYACLAITAMWAFMGVKKRYIFVFVFCVVYAITDEIHQLYVPGRAGSPVDVMIDTVGVAIGLLVYWVAVRLRRKSKSSIE